MLSATIFVSALVSPTIHAQAPTALSRATIDTYNRYTHYAAAIFCKADVVQQWKCGKTCDANKAFTVKSIADYDKNLRLYADWFVGYDSAVDEIIVSVADVGPEELVHTFNDANVALVEPDSDLFPGLAPGVKASAGFLANHKTDAPRILTAINDQRKMHKNSKLTFTGLGVGGAQAQLLLVYTSLQVPSIKSKLKAITYGSPQVGNQAFANYIDTHLTGKLTHINNKQDPTPLLPSRLNALPVPNLPLPVNVGAVLDYHSASGEIHIHTDDSWQKCLGQDNGNEKCSAGAVDALNEEVYRDHSGPYNGVRVECAT